MVVSRSTEPLALALLRCTGIAYRITHMAGLPFIYVKEV